MNTKQLQYFIAAAENESFTKAAQQFHITQTAITLPQIVETLCGCDQQVLTEALRWMLDNDEIKMEINGTVKLSIKENRI